MILIHTLAAAIVCGALGTLGTAPAAAMPVDNLAIKVPGQVENVAWYCNWRGCWWVPARRHHHRWWRGNRHRW
jgi:hypothetical protein